MFIKNGEFRLEGKFETDEIATGKIIDKDNNVYETIRDS